MPVDESISLEARCLACGYSLRGLPEPKCPECGRSFDPADASSYDTRPPGWRWRRWIKRGIAAGMIGAIGIGLFPRGLLKADASFTCMACGEVKTLRRIEPNPPRWIPFRYPGLNWWTTTPVARPCSEGCKGDYDFAINSDLRQGGNVKGMTKMTATEGVSVNGRLMDFESAHLVLNDLLAPLNPGIAIGPTPSIDSPPSPSAP